MVVLQYFSISLYTLSLYNIKKNVFLKLIHAFFQQQLFTPFINNKNMCTLIYYSYDTYSFRTRFYDLTEYRTVVGIFHFSVEHDHSFLRYDMI